MARPLVQQHQSLEGRTRERRSRCTHARRSHAAHGSYCRSRVYSQRQQRRPALLKHKQQKFVHHTQATTPPTGYEKQRDWTIKFIRIVHNKAWFGCFFCAKSPAKSFTSSAKLQKGAANAPSARVFPIRPKQSKKPPSLPFSDHGFHSPASHITPSSHTPASIHTNI